MGSLTYTPTLAEAGTFGSSALGTLAAVPPGHMSPLNVVQNGINTYPFPGATCFDSSEFTPWLQIDLGSSRGIVSATLYSSEWPYPVGNNRV